MLLIVRTCFYVLRDRRTRTEVKETDDLGMFHLLIVL